MRTRTAIVVAACAGVLLLGAGVGAGTRAPSQESETFTAFAMSTGGIRSDAVASQVSFTVDRWSPESARETLSEALEQGGSDALLEALRDLPRVGSLRTPDSLGYPLRYADQQPLEDGGRRIVLATDRPIQFWEARNSAQTLAYPFTVVELHLDDDGSGEGKLSRAARVIALDGRIILENWAGSPVQLTNVQAR